VQSRGQRSGPPDRAAGTPARRDAGTPGCGTPGRRDAGTPGRRGGGTPGRRDAGTPGRRGVGAGTSGRRDAGAAGRRGAGTAARRDAGAPGCGGGGAAGRRGGGASGRRDAGTPGRRGVGAGTSGAESWPGLFAPQPSGAPIGPFRCPGSTASVVGAGGERPNAGPPVGFMVIIAHNPTRGARPRGDCRSDDTMYYETDSRRAGGWGRHPWVTPTG
jgi:hypothetical protein